MTSDTYETVWRAIQRCRDASGHGTATRTKLALLSGVSENTVARAIRAFVADGRIICEAKRGNSGGYLFGPPPRAQTAHQTAHQTAQTAHQTAQNFELCHAFSQTDQAPSGTGLVGLSDSAASQTAHQTAQPQWWTPPPLDAETRKRGAEFFREMRSGMADVKRRDTKGVSRLEAPPKNRRPQ